MPELEKSREFWDREAIQRTHTSWLEHPEIRLYTLRQIDPVNAEWPVDWFTIWLKGRRFARALSIGCGSGEFERDLARHGLCDRIDAFDASLGSIALASQQSRADGHKNLHYFVGDFNNWHVRKCTYDAIFFHQSLHHVERLEELFLEALSCLRPNGLMYLDEYIGPSRTSWSDRLVEPHRDAYANITDDLKLTAELPLPIQEDDPSEAARSDEIMALLRRGFEVLAFRGYGGNMLSVLYPKLRVERLDHADVLRLIALDRAQVSRDGYPYYAVVVATPKRGIARLLAGRKYRSRDRARRQSQSS